MQQDEAMVWLAQANAAPMQEAYWMMRAHTEGLAEGVEEK